MNKVNECHVQCNYLGYTINLTSKSSDLISLKVPDLLIYIEGNVKNLYFNLFIYFLKRRVHLHSKSLSLHN